MARKKATEATTAAAATMCFGERNSLESLMAHNSSFTNKQQNTSSYFLRDQEHAQQLPERVWEPSESE